MPNICQYIIINSLVGEHLVDAADLVAGRDDERDHGRAVASGRLQILDELLHLEDLDLLHIHHYSKLKAIRKKWSVNRFVILVEEPAMHGKQNAKLVIAKHMEVRGRDRLGLLHKTEPEYAC